MGKKGNWFSALKRAFTASSKDNILHISDKNYANEKKKWGLGKSKHGEVNSFVPLYREPSSIEKILGDAENEQQHRTHQDRPKKVQHLQNDEAKERHNILQDPPKKFQHFQAPKHEPLAKSQLSKSQKPKQIVEPCSRGINPSYTQISAIKIQAAFRGYMARKNYRALKGLVRLQTVMRGMSIKRQTANTMKCMQLLVRVQSQVRARRLQMVEINNLKEKRQISGSNEKEMESNFSRWSMMPRTEVDAGEEWDDSVLTKEERDARMRRKAEAVIKRERSLAYAYSHQLLKVTPKSAHAVLTDIRTGGCPWWWNWLDRQLPHEPHPIPFPNTPSVVTPKFTINLRPNGHSQQNIDIFDVSTPRSSKAIPSPRAKISLKTSNKWHQTQLRDDDSLTSCPPFRPAPNYMAPTVSAKAKLRDCPAPGRDGHDGGKKRFSFSLAQSIGSLRWSKGPTCSAKETVPPQRMPKGKHRSTNSTGGLSVDSTVSLPAGVGRKPFK